MSKYPSRVNNLDIEEYHSGPEVSSSQLPTIAFKTLQHLAIDRAKVPTADMRFGSAFHDYVLQPQLFVEKYLESDDAPPLRSSKKGKEEFEHFCLTNGLDPKTTTLDQFKDKWFQWRYHKIQITPSDLQRIVKMTDSLYSNMNIRKYLESGKTERSYFWKDSETDVLCRTRPDLEVPNGLVIDLKSARDASPEMFTKAIFNSCYHWQAAFQLEGISQVTGDELGRLYGWIACEKEEPYGCSLIAAPEEALELGRDCIKRVLKRYRRLCDQGNSPHVYSAKWQYAMVPQWAFYQVDNIDTGEEYE